MRPAAWIVAALPLPTKIAPAVNNTARAIFSTAFWREHAQGYLRSLTICISCHHMISGIHVGGGAGDIAGEIADQAHGDCANVLDGDEPPHRRSLARLVNQLVEMVDPGGGSASVVRPIAPCE
jgi:hypothetical protein